MRIASGGVQHETNTFASQPTTLENFIADSQCGPQFTAGSSIFDRYRGTATIHGGYIAGAESEGLELLPLLCAHAQPAGKVQQSAYDFLLSLFLKRLAELGPVDGVLLDLHGAMVTDRYPDGEGHFIAAVREQVGWDIPIVVTLDLHANISAEMAARADVIIGFDTYPHVDMHERGREAAELMARIVRGEVNPTQAYRQLPLLTLPPMQCTLREPMQSLLRRLTGLEARPGVLTATVSMGFPFADIPDAGVSVLVTTDNDRELAERSAAELAGWLWELRDELRPQLTPIGDVMRYVEDHPGDGLVIVADGSDNPGGGAPCDGTVALRTLLEADFRGALVGILYDPETASQAHGAGVGATIPVRLGGKTDDRHGTPIEMPAYVRALCDGHYTNHGPMLRGVRSELGPMATLVMGGPDGGVEVVVASRRKQTLDVEMLRIAGINITTRRLFVVKSAVHFRADFAPLASRIFDADTPGVHRPDFACFDFRHVRRPIHPLDPETNFGPG